MSSETPAPLIDADLVRRLIGAQFPRWAGRTVEAVRPGGWDNRTFRLGTDMAVRLPSAAAYVPQVDKEHRWLPRLAPRLPLPVPVPLAKGEPADGYPFPWSVYRWLAGAPAAAPDLAGSNEFARSLAGFLAALQAVDAADGPPAGAHNFHRGGDLSVYDGEARAALSALRERIDVAGAEAVWDAALASRWERAPVWVHGDIAWGNLLVRDGRLAAVIDFGSSAVGDPACDLAIAWTCFAGTARQTFRETLPLDRETWARGRGWTLWKALIVASGHDGNQREADAAWRVIERVIDDHRRQRGA